jgi:hypothetical protein
MLDDDEQTPTKVNRASEFVLLNDERWVMELAVRRSPHMDLWTSGFAEKQGLEGACPATPTTVRIHVVLESADTLCAAERLGFPLKPAKG